MQFSYPSLPSPEWISTDGAHFERLVIHCWAEWNGYDIEMHKCLALAQKKLLPIEVEIRSLDVDNSAFWPFLKGQIFNIPSLMMYSKGIHAKTYVGIKSVDDIVKLVKNLGAENL